MLPGVSVFDDDVEDVHVLEHEALRAVRRRISCVATERHRAENGGHEGRVVGDEVEHGVVGAVVHRVEGDLSEIRVNEWVRSADY